MKNLRKESTYHQLNAITLSIILYAAMLISCSEQTSSDSDIMFNSKACLENNGSDSVITALGSPTSIFIGYRCNDKKIEYGKFDLNLTNYQPIGLSFLNQIRGIQQRNDTLLVVGDGFEMITNKIVNYIPSPTMITGADIINDTVVTLNINGLFQMYHNANTLIDSFTVTNATGKIQFQTVQHRLLALVDNNLSTIDIGERRVTSYALLMGTMSLANSEKTFWTTDDSVFYVHNTGIFLVIGSEMVLDSDNKLASNEAKNSMIIRYEPCETKINAYSDTAIYWMSESSWSQMYYDFNGCNVSNTTCSDANTYFVPCCDNGQCGLKKILL